MVGGGPAAAPMSRAAAGASAPGLLFDADAIAGLLGGAVRPEYAQPRVSKEQLGEALARVTAGVSELLGVTGEQGRALAATQQRTALLEKANELLEQRVRVLEASLEDARTRLKRQEGAFVEETARNAGEVRELQKTAARLVPEVEELDQTLQKTLRQSDRQQATIQMLKLDVSKAQEQAQQALEFTLDDEQGGEEDKGLSAAERRKNQKARRSSTKVAAPVDTDGLRVSSEQVFCQNLDANGDLVENGALVPLRELLLRLGKEQAGLQRRADASAQDASALHADVASRAPALELARVDKGLDTACANVEGLLRSFYEAGVLEKAPPKGRLFDKVFTAEPDVLQAPELLAKGASRGAKGHKGHKAGSASPSAAGAGAAGPGAGAGAATGAATSAAEAGAGAGAAGAGAAGTGAAAAAAEEEEEPRGAADALAAIREAPKSRAVGPFGVTQAVRDLSDRLGAEADALNHELIRHHKRAINMRAVLDTKLDAAGVDAKVEVRFDEVINQLEKAIETAGADEEEFKRAARELQDTCSLLNSSKANQADVVEIKKKLELDSRVAEQVQRLQKFMDDKLDRGEGLEILAGKVAKEELGAKLSMLHRRLKSEMELAMDERDGIKPWMVATQLSPEGPGMAGAHAGAAAGAGHATPLEALTCLACNRKITPGQQELLRRAPAVHNACMNKNCLVNTQSALGRRRNNNSSNSGSNNRVTGTRRADAPHVAPFENDGGSGAPEEQSLFSDRHSPAAAHSPHASAKRPQTATALPELHDHKRTGALLRPSSSGGPQKPASAAPPATDAPSRAIWAPEEDEAKTAQDQQRTPKQPPQKVVVMGVLEQVPVKEFSF